MIRVMVVATSPVVRAGLSAVVTTNPRLTVVGSASDLDELAREVGQLQPDVVLIDLSANLQQSVWEKLLLIQEQQYPLGTIAIIEELDSIDLETALRSGIRGILPSTSTELEIVAAVEAIAFGLVVLHPDAIELLSIREKSGGKSCTNIDTTRDRSFRYAWFWVGE